MRASFSRYFPGGTDTRIVSNLSVLNPGLTSRKCRKLLISSPAPTRRMNDIAISATISKPRSRLLRAPPALPRRPSFNPSVRSEREACSAGARPKTKPVTTVSVMVKMNTRASGLISSKRGVLGGLIAISSLISQTLNTRPNAPPKSESSKLSVSS